MYYQSPFCRDGSSKHPETCLGLTLFLHLQPQSTYYLESNITYGEICTERPALENLHTALKHRSAIDIAEPQHSWLCCIVTHNLTLLSKEHLLKNHKLATIGFLQWLQCINI